MQKPFFSLTVSIVIWLIIICGFGFFHLSKKQFLKPEITIDAEMIGEEISEKSPPQLTQKTVKEKKDDKISDLKKSKKPINQAHDHHFLNKEILENSKISTTKLVYQPLPKIPDELRSEAFATKAIARFYILANGEVEKVELIKMANNPKLNYLLLKSLRNWKFEEKSQNSIQDIEVVFEVK